MASFPKLLPFIFLLFFSFQSQTQARDSQFFSKVTRHHDPTTSTNYYNPETTTTNTNTLKENDFSTLTKQEELDPTFVPQTAGTGYGLYGHETGLDPPSTTTTTSLYDVENNNVAYENHNNYAPELKGLSEFNNKRKNDEGVGYYGGVEKQGMSDTRFLEKGKYYYDLDAERKRDNNYGSNYMSYNNNNNYNKNNEFYGNGENKNQEFYNNNNYNTNYNNNGFYGNGENKNEEFYNNNNYNTNYKNNGFYGNEEYKNEEFYNNNNNNNNNNYNGNAMQGYQQNQKLAEEEFDFDP